MGMVNLGLNSDSIHYEVALEILGQSRQPYMKAFADEEACETPSGALIKFLKMRLDVLDEFQDELVSGDLRAIEIILDKDSRLVS